LSLSLGVGNSYELIDRDDRVLGRVRVDEVRGRVFLGSITPSQAFNDVRALFAQHEDMVNQQVFPVVDELEEEIAALKLRLRDVATGETRELANVQIMNEDDITFR
jgi:hypothetical protein